MSKIEWTNETINPLGWGCYGPGGTPEKPQPCSYCYGRRFAARNTRGCDLCRQFIPHWHPEMLDKSHHWKKPRRIFVQSMGDLFHPCTPQFQIELVLAMVKALPHHTFQFLTKNPKRLREFNPWPPNCWVGTTVTNQADADERIPLLLHAGASVRFVSVEPLMGPVDLSPWLNYGLETWPEGHPESPYPDRPGGYSRKIPGLSWVIIGALTGPGAVKPKGEWVQGIIDQCRAPGVSVFVKNNLNWPEKIQEWPK
jgi:protein gp37